MAVGVADISERRKGSINDPRGGAA
jgi:hypothetical protein